MKIYLLFLTLVFIQFNLFSQRFKIENGDTLPRKIYVETFERISPYDTNEIMVITDSIIERADHTFELINGEIVNEIIDGKYFGKHISKYSSGKIEIDYYINDARIYPSLHIDKNDTTGYFQKEVAIQNIICLEKKYISKSNDSIIYIKRLLDNDTLIVDNTNGTSLFSAPNVESEIIHSLKQNDILIQLPYDSNEKNWNLKFIQYNLTFLGEWLKVKTNSSKPVIGYIPSVFLSDKKN